MYLGYSEGSIINVFRLSKARLYLSYEHNVVDDIKSLQIPIYLLHGKEDYLLSFKLAKEFYERLEADKKEFIEFENSAHMLPFEEADRFNSVVIKKLLQE